MMGQMHMASQYLGRKGLSRVDGWITFPKHVLKRKTRGPATRGEGLGVGGPRMDERELPNWEIFHALKTTWLVTGSTDAFWKLEARNYDVIHKSAIVGGGDAPGLDVQIGKHVDSGKL